LSSQRLKSKEHAVVSSVPGVSVLPTTDWKDVHPSPEGAAADQRVVVHEGVAPVETAKIIFAPAVQAAVPVLWPPDALFTGADPVEDAAGTASELCFKQLALAAHLVLAVLRHAEGQDLELKARELSLQAPKDGSKPYRDGVLWWTHVKDVVEVQDNPVGPLIHRSRKKLQLPATRQGDTGARGGRPRS
jgi:hypothetical protein